MIINPKTVNETRFQYDFQDRESTGSTPGVGIIVQSSFSGGGAQIGHNFTRSNRWEVNNNTTTSLGKNSQHAIKFGIRVRGVKITDQSQSNYGGTFTFAGIPEVRNPSGCDPVGPNCVVVQPAVTSLQQYQQKVL